MGKKIEDEEMSLNDKATPKASKSNKNSKRNAKRNIDVQITFFSIRPLAHIFAISFLQPVIGSKASSPSPSEAAKEDPSTPIVNSETSESDANKTIFTPQVDSIFPRTAGDIAVGQILQEKKYIIIR